MPGADGHTFGRTTLSHRSGTATERMSSPPPKTGSRKNTQRIGEASFLPSHREHPSQGNGNKSRFANRICRDIKLEDEKIPDAQVTAIKRSQDTIKKIKRENGVAEVKESTIPYGQVRSMFQGRLQSLMLQNRKQCRQLFRRWDPDNKGFITQQRFHGLLQEFGVNMDREQSDSFMAKFVDVPSRITFNELFFGVMGLPIDFFSMKLTGGEGIVDDAGSRSQVRPPLPRGTSFKKAEQIFKTGLRQSLYNVEAAINHVFERPGNGSSKMTKTEFWTMLNARGLLTTAAELDELVAHFDQNCDGLIDYYELAHEMLRLPKPGHVKDISSWHEHRPRLSTRCMSIIKRLREMCERKAAPPAALYKMFTRYDADGSGKIAYDEVVEMVRDTGTQVEGKDMTSEFLTKYSCGDGELSYQRFIVEVLGLRPDALRTQPAVPGNARPPTAEIVEQVSDGVKRHIQRDEGAVERVFHFFDKDNAGEMRFAEFAEGVNAMGLPITRPQMKQMFKEFDIDRSGCLDVQEFARDVMGIEIKLNQSSRSNLVPLSPPLRTGAVSALGQNSRRTHRSSPQRPASTMQQNFGAAPFTNRSYADSAPQMSQRSPSQRSPTKTRRSKMPVPAFSLTKLGLS